MPKAQNQTQNILTFGRGKKNRKYKLGLCFFYSYQCTNRLKKPKKPSPMPSESKKSISEGNSRRLSVDSRDAASKTSSPRRQSNSAHQFREDEQFTIKGKKLLGKYYNGPTQWYTPKVKSK